MVVKIYRTPAMSIVSVNFEQILNGLSITLVPSSCPTAKGRQREFGFLMRARSWLATALVGNAGQPCERAQRVLTPANSFKLPPLGSMGTFIKELIETLFDFSLSDVFVAVSLPERGV